MQCARVSTHLTLKSHLVSYSFADSNAVHLLMYTGVFFFPFSYMSKEILTIREAVWLTDNTYKYEDLVRMMGEIVSVLGGKIRVSSINFPSSWRGATRSP